jgi:hypothetical protein
VDRVEHQHRPPASPLLAPFLAAFFVEVVSAVAQRLPHKLPVLRVVANHDPDLKKDFKVIHTYYKSLKLYE